LNQINNHLLMRFKKYRAEFHLRFALREYVTG
jgi:hypothetical protein